MTDQQNYYICVFDKTGFSCKELKDNKLKEYNIPADKVYNTKKKCMEECEKQSRAFREKIPSSYEKLYTTDKWGQFKHMYALVTGDDSGINTYATIRYPFTPKFFKCI